MCTWQTAMKTSSRIQRQALFNSWSTHLTSPLCFASLLERSVNRTDGLVWTRHSGINTPASSVHVSSKDPRGLIRANCFATRLLLSSDNAASMASEGIVFVWEQICRTWAEQINDSLLARTPIFSLNGSCKLATSCWLCFGQMEKKTNGIHNYLSSSAILSDYNRTQSSLRRFLSSSPGSFPPKIPNVSRYF